jgi:hypothetical protein
MLKWCFLKGVILKGEDTRETNIGKSLNFFKKEEEKCLE